MAINSNCSVRNRILFLCFLCCMWPMVDVFAQDRVRHEFCFRHDNDLYLATKQDQYYTNGVFLKYAYATKSSKLSRREVNRTVRFTFGHEMYNAFTAYIDTIDLVDRPITAYMFLRAELNRHFKSEGYFNLGIEVGTIGERALGRQAQELIHRGFKLYDVAGWEYQLENAYGVDIRAGYGKMLYRVPAGWLDLSIHAQASLGLNNTRVNAYPSLRIGRMNPLHTSASADARIQSRDEVAAKEVFVFYNPHASWVAYDATVQGGYFLEEKGPVTSEPIPWVYASEFGFVYAARKTTLSFKYLFNTKEVKSMYFRHQYGTVGIAHRF